MATQPTRPETSEPADEQATTALNRWNPALTEPLQAALARTAVLGRQVDEDPAGVIVQITELVDGTLDPSNGPFPAGVRRAPASVRILCDH